MGAAASKSKMRPSGERRYNTGVAHSKVPWWLNRIAYRARDTGVERQLPGDGAVEGSGELGRGSIDDLELHCDHGRDPVPGQRTGGTGERAEGAGPPGVAGVEHDQAQGAMLGQQQAQIPCAKEPRAPVLVGQRDDALVGAVVEAAVPDEVQDVPSALVHRALQITPCLTLDPGELHLAVTLQCREGHVQPAPLALDVQRVPIAGRRDHSQDPQGRGHPQRGGWAP